MTRLAVGRPTLAVLPQNGTKKQSQKVWNQKFSYKGMSRVEELATVIKIESSNQRTFWEPIKDQESLKSIDQERMAAIWPLTLENQALEGLRRKQSSNFLPIKSLIPVANTWIGSMQATTPWSYTVYKLSVLINWAIGNRLAHKLETSMSTV